MTFDRHALVSRIAPAARALGVSALVAGLAGGCSHASLSGGSSSSYLIVKSLQASSGAQPGVVGGTLSSDVITCVKSTDATVDFRPVCEAKGLVPTLFSDGGAVNFNLGLKDPGTADSPTKPTPANFVTLTRYHVDFLGINGSSTPFVDVPAGFDGAMTVTVNDVGGSGTFTLVPISAKQQAPLAGLGTSGGTVQNIARVTFFGADQTGRPVQVTADISVTFANWADPQ